MLDGSGVGWDGWLGYLYCHPVKKRIKAAEQAGWWARVAGMGYCALWPPVAAKLSGCMAQAAWSGLQDALRALGTGVSRSHINTHRALPHQNAWLVPYRPTSAL